MKIENYQETRIITDVTESEDYYSITCGGVVCGLRKEYGVVPKVGDKLTVHTKDGKFGTIRGMALNGELIFWKTNEDLEAERREWLHKNEEEKQQRFKENVAKMDERYNDLPKCFQDRINKFRANNDRFRIDYEDYELFCCEQAVIIANACKTAEEVKSFANKRWDEQLQQVPELSNDHSGNTFSMACSLAYWYLTNPENVVKLHGSLSSLVGCDKYGDVPNIKKQTKVKKNWIGLKTYLAHLFLISRFR
jgi:hypothetical protein